MLAALSLLALAGCDSGPGADEFRAQAQAFETAGQLNAAVVALKNALGEEPEHAQTRLHLGRIYLTLGYGEAAIKELERARSLGVDDAASAEALVRALLLGREYERAQSLLDEVDLAPGTARGLRGYLALARGDIEQAGEHFRAALAAEQDNLYALRGQARIALARRELLEAARLLAIAAEKHPQSVPVWIDIANLELERGRYDQAHDAAARALEHSADIQQARYAMARALLGQGKTADARKHLEWLNSLHTRNTTLSYLSAVASMQDGDQSAARNHLLEGLKLNADHIPSLLLLGLHYHDVGELRQAESTLEQVRALAPAQLTAIRLLATVKLKLNNAEGAIELLRMAVRARPREPDLAMMLGRAYLAANRPQQAAEQLGRAVELAPNATGARQDLAMSLLNAGDAAAAGEQMQQVVDAGGEGTGTDADVLLVLSRVQSGDLAAAEQAAQAFARRLPQDPLAHTMLGIVHELKRDAASARAAYARALELDPGAITAALNLAALDRAQGDAAAARDRYQRLLAAHPDHPDALLALAAMAAAEGKHDEAMDHLRQARRANPQALEPRLALARIHLRNGRLQDGLEVAEEAVRLADTNRDALWTLARLQAAAGIFEKARATAERLLQAHPTFVPGLLELARALVGQGDLAAAREAVNRATRLEPDNARALLARGGLELATGDLAAARASAEALRAMQPDAVAAGVFMARVRLRAGEAREALALARELAAAHPDSSAVPLVLAEAHGALGDAAAAEQVLREVVKRDPGNLDARLALARISVAAGRIDDARAHLDAALVLAPGDPRALSALAELESEHGDSARAVELAESARGRDARAVRPRVVLASEYLEQRRLAEAASMAEELLAIAPDSPDVQLLWSKVQLLSGNVDAAREAGKRALAANADSYEAHYQMALVHNFAGDQVRAAESLRRTRELAPDFLPAQLSLVEAATRLGRTDEALEVARALQRRFPDLALGYGLEGDILARQGQLDAARKAYQAAGARGAPGTAAVRLARARIEAGDAAGAMQELRGWLAQHPDDRKARELLAERALVAGDTALAIEQYETLLQASPRSLVALNNLANLYHQSGQTRKGLDHVERALALRPDMPQLLDTYGWLLTESGQAEKGVQVLSRAAAALPEAGSVRFHLAMAYLKAGDLAAAKKELLALKNSKLEFAERGSIDVYLQAMQ